MICGSFNYQRVFSVKYVVMDTSNIVLWVSVSLVNQTYFFSFYIRAGKKSLVQLCSLIHSARSPDFGDVDWYG